jgi:hypothetical protein
MSRSYKHYPAITWIGESNKEDKRIANRRFRKINKDMMRHNKIPLQNIRECSDNWDFLSDGLAYYNADLDKKYLRK